MAASRKSKRFWIWLGSGAAVVVLVLGFALVRLAKGTSIDPNKLAKVTRGDVARSVVATGKIQPITKVEVKSKASGIVEKLYVDINDRVKKGQQLAQLDQRRFWRRWTRSGRNWPRPRPMWPRTRPISSRTR